MSGMAASQRQAVVQSVSQSNVSTKQTSTAGPKAAIITVEWSMAATQCATFSTTSEASPISAQAGQSSPKG